MDCLVAVGRIQSTLDRPIEDAVNRGLDIVPGIEFSARHTMDGMFTFIDPKVTPILGYLPQELSGSSVYEHVLYDDIPGLVEGHRRALKARDEVKVAPIKFRYVDVIFSTLCVHRLYLFNGISTQTLYFQHYAERRFHSSTVCGTQISFFRH